MLAGFGFFKFFQIARAGFAIDAAYFVVGLQSGLFQLGQNQLPGERNDAYVVAGIRLDGHLIAFDEV